MDKYGYLGKEGCLGSVQGYLVLDCWTVDVHLSYRCDYIQSWSPLICSLALPQPFFITKDIASDHQIDLWLVSWPLYCPFSGLLVGPGYHLCVCPACLSTILQDMTWSLPCGLCASHSSWLLHLGDQSSSCCFMTIIIRMSKRIVA